MPQPTKLLLSILTVAIAVFAATGLSAQLPIREAAAPDTFDADKVLPTLDLKTVKDGQFAPYAGPLADCPEVKAFVAALPTVRSEAIAAQRAFFNLPKDFSPVALVRVCDRDTTDTGGEDMETTSALHNATQRMVAVVSVYSASLIHRRCTPARTLLHESNHALLREYLGKDYSKLPRWFREGIAVFSAGQRDERIRMLLASEVWNAKSVADAAGSVESLCRDLNDGSSFKFEDYAQAVLWVEYLVSRNAEAVRSTVASLKAGKTLEEAITEASGLSFADYCGAARGYARRTLYAIEAGSAVELSQLSLKHKANLKASTDAEKTALREVIAAAQAFRKKNPAHYATHMLLWSELRSLAALNDHVAVVALAGPALKPGGGLTEGTYTMLALRYHAASCRALGKTAEAIEGVQRVLYGYGYVPAMVTWAKAQLDGIKQEAEKEAAKGATK